MYTRLLRVRRSHLNLLDSPFFAGSYPGTHSDFELRQKTAAGSQQRD